MGQAKNLAEISTTIEKGWGSLDEYWPPTIYATL